MLWKIELFTKKKKQKKNNMKEKKLGFKYFLLPYIIIKSIVTMVEFSPQCTAEQNITSLRTKC